MNVTSIEDLCDDIVEQSGGGRYLLGICGPPGSGKSTLARELVNSLNQSLPGSAIVVPMDGFHFNNEILSDMGLLELKGIPASFDAAGYVALLQTVSDSFFEPTASPIYCPAFDRSIERSLQRQIVVQSDHRFVVTEGNYLLLDKFPWSQVAGFCDQVWYLDIESDVLQQRLVPRHVAGGKSQEAAEAKVVSTDLPNAVLVRDSRMRASRIFSQNQIPLL